MNKEYSFGLILTGLVFSAVTVVCLTTEIFHIGSAFLAWSVSFSLLAIGILRNAANEERIIVWLFDDPRNLFFVLLFVVLYILVFLDLYYLLGIGSVDFGEWSNIIVEAHGLVFDILLFGLVFYSYDKIKERKFQIKRYNEELDDYRGWSDNEAAFRVAGLYKRLIDNGYLDIDLSNLHVGRLPKEKLYFCVLNEVAVASYYGADFSGIKFDKRKYYLTDKSLQASSFRECVINKLTLVSCSLVKSTLIKAQISNCDFQDIDLSDSNLSSAVVSDSDIGNSILRGTILERTKFINCTFSNVDFRLSRMNSATFQGCKYHKCMFSGARIYVNNESLMNDFASFYEEYRLSETHPSPYGGVPFRFVARLNDSDEDF